MSWQRARSPEKIIEREAEIINAAKKLFQKQPYHEISLNGIAREAGFAKSNVYRYFATREEIFLLIFTELFEVWSQDILGLYKKTKAKVKVETFAKGFVKTSLRHEQFLELLPQLFSSLEKNSSRQQLLKFKRMTNIFIQSHGVELRRIFPNISKDGSFFFLRMAQALFANFWTSSHPNKELAKIYKEKEFKDLAPRFEQESVHGIVVILLGLTRKS